MVVPFFPLNGLLRIMVCEEDFLMKTVIFSETVFNVFLEQISDSFR